MFSFALAERQRSAALIQRTGAFLCSFCFFVLSSFIFWGHAYIYCFVFSLQSFCAKYESNRLKYKQCKDIIEAPHIYA